MKTPRVRFGVWLGLPVIVLAALVACQVHPNLVTCGEIECPENIMCHLRSDGSHSCVEQRQLDACNGAADGQHCRVGGRNGACDAGACLLAECGNEVVEAGEQCDGFALGVASCTTLGYSAGQLACTDACQFNLDACGGKCGDFRIDGDFGEVCDDGILSSGDGCAFDCRSLEVCGNGIVDFAPGEQCDDPTSVGLSGDGCASACVRENPQWSRTTDNVVFPSRTGAAMAYSPSLGALIMTGASNVDFGSDETWSFDGMSWTKIPNAGSFEFGNRAGAKMVCDRARKRITLFGGSSVNTTDRTWFFSGSKWEKALSPTPAELYTRQYFAMSYHDQQQKIFLYGGYNSDFVFRQETWSFDGETWTQVSDASPSTMPKRLSPGMAYDANLGKLVMFGGMGEDYTNQRDTWVFDGTTWVEVLGAAPPEMAGITAPELTYDPIRKKTVMYGGYRDPDYSGDTWEFDGATWSKIPDASPPQFSARADGAAAFFAKLGKVVYFGGRVANGGEAGTAVWALSNDTWTILGDVERAKPSPRSGAVAAFDAIRGEVVVFGGYVNGVAQKQTWAVKNGNWRQLVDAAPPEMNARGYSTMVYDTKRQRVVLYGGLVGASALGDFWTLENDHWVPLPLNSPAGFVPRYGHAMAYDPIREAIIIQGGFSPVAPGALRRDTWMLEGSTLTELPPSEVGHFAHAMTFDRRLGKLVLFGGAIDIQGAPLTTTMLFDGDAWSHSEAQVPSVILGKMLPLFVYEPLLQKNVLFGGNARPETYYFDGDSWTPATNATPPDLLGTIGSAYAYDALQSSVVMFGGETGQEDTADIWELSSKASFLGLQEQREDCSQTQDKDLDGLSAANDPDCFAVFRPLCAPFSPCDPLPGKIPPNASMVAAQPHCGDSQCNARLETALNCPQDCAVCGDLLCETPIETAASCAVDCAD